MMVICNLSVCLQSVPPAKTVSSVWSRTVHVHSQQGAWHPVNIYGVSGEVAQLFLQE